jgi:hypothetical protein
LLLRGFDLTTQALKERQQKEKEREKEQAKRQQEMEEKERTREEVGGVEGVGRGSACMHVHCYSLWPSFAAAHASSSKCGQPLNDNLFVFSCVGQPVSAVHKLTFYMCAYLYELAFLTHVPFFPPLCFTAHCQVASRAHKACGATGGGGESKSRLGQRSREGARRQPARPGI